MVKNQVNLSVSSKIKGNKDVTFLVVSLLISAVSLYFLAGPARNKTLVLQRENVVKEKDLQSKQELLANIQSFNEENKDAGVNSKKLAAFVSNRNNYEDYFFHLRELAKQSNLEISSMELQAEKVSATSPAAAANNAAGTGETAVSGENTAAPKLKEQYITLSLRGSFENMLYFYKALENGIPFVQTVSADILHDAQTVGENGAVGQGQNLSPVLISKITLKFNYY